MPLCILGGLMFSQTTTHAITQKYKHHFDIIGPILELPEAGVPSIETLKQLIEAALSNYNIHIRSEHETTTRAEISWDLYELKALENLGGWSVAEMTCAIHIYKIDDMYVIGAHRLHGDRGRFSTFLEDFKFNLTGEKFYGNRIRSFLPPRPLPMTTVSTQDYLEGYRPTLVHMQQPNFKHQFEFMPLIASLAESFVKMRNKAAPEDYTAVDAMADETIAIVLNFIAEDLAQVDATGEHLISNMERQEIASLTRMAVQCIYALSQSSYYFDKLKTTPNLVHHLTALANYRPTHPEEQYIYAEMHRTCHEMLHKLDKYKASLEFIFPKKTEPKTLPRGLNMRYVPGDGHCLYHAVRIHLPNNPSVENLRTLVADYVTAHREDYEGSIAGSFDAYVAGIRTNAWGDHIEIDALMHIYQRPIFIFHENGDPVTRPQEQEAFPGEPIPVLFDDVNHYNAVVLTTNLPFNLQQAVRTTATSLIPKIPTALSHLIATFLSTSDLEHFLGGAKRAKVLFERKEPLITLSMFSSASTAEDKKNDSSVYNPAICHPD